MKPSPMEVSPIAYDLIKDCNEWLEQSSKTSYRFSKEEQYYLEQMIKVMNNQIDLLVDYELKKEEK